MFAQIAITYMTIKEFFDKFPYINVSAFARECGINPSLMRRFKQGEVTPSQRSLERIREGLKRVCADLNEMTL